MAAIKVFLGRCATPQVINCSLFIFAQKEIGNLFDPQKEDWPAIRQGLKAVKARFD